MKGKRIAVLGDNQLLCDAIRLSLCSHLRLEVVEPLPGALEAPHLGAIGNHLDLIVVAMSSPEGEPLLALVRASLAERVGRTPLLIITERPFAARPDERISHLAFPFRPDELQAKVSGILAGA